MKTNKSATTRKTFLIFFSSPQFLDIALTLAVFAIMLIILINPTRYTSGTISGIKLFFYSVLPGLFPFMFLTKLLTEMGAVYKFSSKLDKFSYKVFGTPGISMYALLMSILSGYPIGAKIIGELYESGKINEKDAKKMSVFCTTSGPIFIIASVGAVMFGSVQIGVIIYVSHIISSIFMGIFSNLISKIKMKGNKKINSKNVKINTNSQQKIHFGIKNSNLITDCLVQTVNSLFVVGAYITIFFLLTEILESLKIINFFASIFTPILQIFGLSNEFSSGIIYGILEVTRGVKTLACLNLPASIILATGLISFSGLSIIMQSMAFLKKAKIKTHNFVFFKIVHSCLSMIICGLLVMIL